MPDQAMDRPIVTVREWAQTHSVPERTALHWAASGHLSAYQSPLERGVWLVRAAHPHPGALPQGRRRKARQ